MMNVIYDALPSSFKTVPLHMVCDFFLEMLEGLCGLLVLAINVAIVYVLLRFHTINTHSWCLPAQKSSKLNFELRFCY